MTSLKNMSVYDRCDFLIGFPTNGNNNVERLGYDRNNTLGEMIDLALAHKCPIIIKSGRNGKWYLKGQGKTNEFLKDQIQRKTGTRREGVICYFLEFH
jgi:hypothetical protein